METSDKVSPPNSDDLLSPSQIVIKYQRDFAKYFLPKHVFSVMSVSETWGDDGLAFLTGLGRNKHTHHSTKGTQSTFQVPSDKFNVWRKNIKLYSFISNK